MFTFGRDHERNCAIRNLRRPAEADRILGVVDAVHDVIDGAATIDSVRPIFVRSFSEGGSGVWEQTGSWLLKLSADQPTLSSVWYDLANSPDGKVRFRVACFLNDLPRPIALEIGEQLRTDRSKKTREMAVARLEEIGA